eukprot:CAMPEP_0177599838 /NCGR_PEP_ID=MMETSP0419_2-20121207/13241_1 /TAXON_ID=582737 /ORGANISM="Tetraselmis sp., Strain GSL018" /LENGTH=261 /DNA_ID=CAMNT_0019092667 /DNA_START=165 /DNA_END=951 /DNA_ORIENTATION=-
MLAARNATVLRGASLQARAPRVQARQPCARRVMAMAVNNEVIGSNYANALVEIAQEQNALEAIHSDMDALSAVFSENRDVAEYLQSPVVQEGEKKKMIATLSKEAGFNSFTTNFLNLLVDKQRMDSMEDVMKAFETKYCELTDTQVAIVRSAVKLEQEQQLVIAKKLQELTGAKNIKLRPEYDETLIAGFIVEYGSNQIDLSVKGAIERVKTQLQTVELEQPERAVCDSRRPRVTPANSPSLLDPADALRAVPPQWTLWRL